MSFPPLVIYTDRTQYKRHYENVYCRSIIVTFDDIRVYFKPQRFGHAFYESTPGGGKTIFSQKRAERIDWIKAVLESPDAELYQGWSKNKKVYVPDRRVSVMLEDYVVVIELRLIKGAKLKGDFITAYVADTSINKIRSSPTWTLQACLDTLQKKNRR